VSFQRGIDGSEPLRPEPITRLAGPHEERRVVRGVLGVGTLACPSCDAPVAPAGAPLAPADPLSCPFCLREGRVRDFLSLSGPPRPARVEVRIVDRAPQISALPQRRRPRRVA
jgi:hypothetical protein